MHTEQQRWFWRMTETERYGFLMDDKFWDRFWRRVERSRACRMK